MIHRFAPLLVLVLAAACNQSAPLAVEEASAPPPVAAPASTDGVRTDGVGPISAATRFDRDAIAALFPGAEVEAAFLHDGPTTSPIITVFRGAPSAEQALGLEIGGSGAAISYVRVDGGDYTGPRGEALLAPWPSLGFTTADCAMGTGRDLNALVCRRADAPSLAYVIGVRGWTGPGLPTEAKLAADGFLREMRWTPGAAN